MSGIVPVFEHGPITYEVVEAVTGGQLVEARAGGKIGVAAAGSLVSLGVATKDAIPTTTDQQAAGVNYAPKPPYVAVGRNAFYRITYAANANFGDALIVAANGQVTPAGATPDARTLVGYCADPNGAVAGSTAITYIGK